MIDIDLYIREKLKEAREDTGLSQRELAELMHSSQGTISDLERGRIRINAADLARFAEILDKPILYFYPDVMESDLTEKEQILIRTFRRLSDTWQKSILEQVKAQVALYEATAQQSSAEVEIQVMPEEEQEDAAYQQVYKWLKPLIAIGFRIYVDDKGNVTVGSNKAPGLRIPLTWTDEKDKKIALELQSRYDLDKLDK